jgi:hypothetical protein
MTRVAEKGLRYRQPGPRAKHYEGSNHTPHENVGHLPQGDNHYPHGREEGQHEPRYKVPMNQQPDDVGHAPRG